MAVKEQLGKRRRAVIYINVRPLSILGDRELQGGCAIKAVVDRVIDMVMGVVAAPLKLDASFQDVDGTRNENGVDAELDVASRLTDLSTDSFNESYQVQGGSQRLSNAIRQVGLHRRIGDSLERGAHGEGKLAIGNFRI